ncbi:unnamed protein product [Notodromas monacha]|uniref:Neurotransmitter-gated ion-channel ligand-binding domain-containing protein n=1 Tax=Notodromas monacha TaxID=399045 RepID=A0A7R9BDZ4_9CRUS|nr:unnamed protein product [Notodromas monacha]CAG0912407.1 unnamed protein product [Notodromas monacha]
MIGLDEKSQILTTNAELVLEWDDYFLQWDPANFSNIKSTRLDPSRLWFPDIILYNSASTDYRAGLVSTYLMVTYTGRVKYLVEGIFQSVCNLDVSYFPFDEQICTLKFSPWTMDKSAVRMNASLPENGLKRYVAVGKFKMISLEPKKSTTEDPCCIGTNFDDVTYYMKFQRRPTYYIINYIFPSVLINMIGIMIFYVPCGSGEKISLGISAMLTLVVFLMAMTDALPPADTIPLLTNQLLERADKALAMMEVSQQQHKDADYKNVLTLEYLELARIYDRFFLVLYSILTVTASFGTLLSSPYASSVGI